MSNRLKVFEGKNIYLRPMEVKDAEMLYHSFNDPENMRLTGTHRAFSHNEIESILQSLSRDKGRISFAIVTQEDNQVIGDIGFNDMQPPYNRSAELGIAIFSSCTNSGYGTEAMKLMLEYGFGVLNLHRIELEVYSFNERAIHVYEKLGFRVEGIKRDVVYYNHHYYNSTIMSMLEHDYRELYTD